MALTINHETNDISATSGSVTLDGSAVGGGGSLNHISTQTVTSSTASVTFSSVSGYDYYKIFFSGDLTAGGGSLKMRFLDGGTEISSGYRTGIHRTGGGVLSGSASELHITDVSSRGQISAEISIGANTSYPRMLALHYSEESGNQSFGRSGGIPSASVTNLNGFKIFPTSGTISSAKISLYGVSQS